MRSTRAAFEGLTAEIKQKDNAYSLAGWAWRLKRRPNQDVHERTRPDKIAVAIEHLEQAMVALFMASQE